MNKIRLIIFFNFIFSTTMFNSQDLTGNVFVDFQKKQSVNSMVGFLHFNDINKLQKDIKELKPKYWRFRYRHNTSEIVNQLLKNNVTPIIVISDQYGYTDDPNWKSPLSTNKYESITKKIYQELGNNVIYDIWNEPYLKGFGGFSSKDFFALFKKAHNVIRSLPGGQNALITGPSFHELKRSEMEDFFRFCNQNKIKVDVLSWHEWRNEADLKIMQSDIEWVKNVLLPAYPQVGVKKIVLTEIVHLNIQFSPTQVYKVYDVLEKNKIDGACRGCFAESNGVDNCENNSVTGLLDNSGNRRSIWWATKLYAKSTENRVFSSANLENLITFASYDDKSANLLLANNYKKPIKNSNINLKIDGLSSLENTKKLKLTIYKIPNTGEDVLEEPIFVSSKVINVKRNTLNIDIKDFSPQEVLSLTLTK